MTADILIIGGGIIGLSCALKLAQQGRRVTLLEKQACGSGVSGDALGTLVTPPPTRDGEFSHILRQSVARYDTLCPEWEEQTGLPTGFAKSGSITLLGNDQQKQDTQRDFAIPDCWLAQKDAPWLQAQAPGLKATEHGIIYDPTSRAISPPLLVQALKKMCLLNNVEILENTPVAKLCLENDHANGVFLENNDKLLAEKTVVTASFGSSSLLQPAGLTLPIRAIRGQALVVRTQKPLLGHIIRKDRRFEENLPWPGSHLHLCPWPDNHIAIGATVEPDNDSRQPEKDMIDHIFAEACDLMPSLKNAEIIRTWAGLRPRGPGRKPYIGKAPDVENLYIAAGHHRVGFYLAPYTAEKISALIT